jgi:hypothetical protein
MPAIPPLPEPDAVPSVQGVPLRRVVVYGVTGSGKSVAAERLGRLLGLPYVAIDDLMWEPGWVMVGEQEKRRRIEEVCAGESWVIDSVYQSWVDVPLATPGVVVVGLDYGRLLTLGRLLRRTAQRWVTRTRVCNGNLESLRNLVGRGSIVAWHFQSFDTAHERLVAWEADPVLPPVLRFTRPTDLDRWIASLGTA